jgi:hypothetical protein
MALPAGKFSGAGSPMGALGPVMSSTMGPLTRLELKDRMYRIILGRHTSESLAADSFSKRVFAEALTETYAWASPQLWGRFF